MRPTEEQVFCPKCGARLSTKVSEVGTLELCCLPGDMCLSQDLQSRLELRYGLAAASPLSVSQLFSQQLHGGLHWFCPGDGTPLNAELECPQCGKHVRDLAYVLVELHPHRPVAERDERPCYIMPQPDIASIG
jgi:endogenous inhibitor of DNA gyrase (YacG/DUF329 family)